MTSLRATYLSMVLLGLTSTSVWSQELTFNTQNSPPFSYERYGVVSGAAAEIVEAVCAEMDVICNFKVLPWAQAQDQVKKGEANGLFAIAWNEKRATWAHFTPPLLRTEYGIFVRGRNPLEYDRLAKIQGYEISVYGHSDTAKALQDIRLQMTRLGMRPIEIKPTSDYEAGFKQLTGDRVDAVFADREVGYGVIARLGLEGEVRYAGPARKLKYYVGFSKAHNDPAVINRFNATYVRLHKQGVIKQILDRFFLDGAEL